MIRRLLITLWIVAGLAPTPGCGPSARTRAVRAALVAANVSRATFVTQDLTAQQRLIDAATSLADGQQKLATYRAAREHMLGLFVAAYRALASAAMDPRAPEVAAALVATQRLAEALRTLFPEAP
jgi:hypothetical protein